MATTAVTTQVTSAPIPSSISSSSPSPTPGSPTRADFARGGVEAAPAETISPTAAPESTTGNSVESQPRAAVPHEQSQNGELSPQDFSSLEDYAKALIEKKQSAASRDRSAVEEDKGAPISAEQDPNDAEVNEIQPEESEETQVGAQPPGSPARADVARDGVEVPSAANADLDLDGEDFLSTKALNDRINANAALKQVLEADQNLRNAMFRNARLASEAAGYKEIFPDLDSARYAANQAAAFADLDHAFMRGDSRQGAEQFFGKWAQMAMLTDENGNVVRDQNGNPRMHGVWNAVNQHIFDSQLDLGGRKGEGTGGDELGAALDVIRESVSPSSPATDGLPPHLRAAADSINRREQELLRQQFAQQERDALAFDESVGEE